MTGTSIAVALNQRDLQVPAGLQRGPAGDGGLAARASLGTTIGSVRPDRAGNLVLADNGDDRRYFRVAAVAYRDRGPDTLRGQQAGRVLGKCGGHRGMTWAWHVIAERDPDLAVAPLGPDHHDAVPGVEAEQAGDDREHGGR